MDGSKDFTRPTLGLRKDRYSALVKGKGWVTHEDQARGLGLAQSTISRTLKGDQRPGADFIGALLAAFPRRALRICSRSSMPPRAGPWPDMAIAERKASLPLSAFRPPLTDEEAAESSRSSAVTGTRATSRRFSLPSRTLPDPKQRSRGAGPREQPHESATSEGANS